MLKRMKKAIWKVEGMEYKDSPVDQVAEFQLHYNDILIGTLTYSKGLWAYKYSDEFKNHTLRPIIDFPDKYKVYKSPQLWPFFATRIPVINQPYHHKKIEKANAQIDDSVALLRIFGRNTITNPYRLMPV